jgi:hypothetical protein
MSLYHDSKQKLRNIQRTVDHLLDSDFPLSAGQNALRKLREVFSELEKKLDRAHKLSDSRSEAQISNIINVKVYQTLPILGFILRSTNVRNAFELLEPLQVIAEATLQGRPQLLLSSEWDFVPFAYPQSLEDLRSFVLIGMPSSEAASALLLPLAGHELGHAVWRNRGVGGGVQAVLQPRCEELYAENFEDFQNHFPEYSPTDIVYRELLPEAVSRSVDYAMFQAEELFCDMFAYALFGESYVYAFAYILAPGSGMVPASKYPTHKIRMTVLRDIAQMEGVRLPELSDLNFAEERERRLPRDRFILRMAETSVAENTSGLWRNVTALIAEGQVPRPDSAISHLRQFKMGIPAHEPKCLGDITNAGWAYYRELRATSRVDSEFWEKLDELNEMILKTIEVMEYRNRIGDDPKRK